MPKVKEKVELYVFKDAVAHCGLQCSPWSLKIPNELYEELSHSFCVTIKFLIFNVKVVFWNKVFAPIVHKSITKFVVSWM
jgi:hypothetical protein